MSEDGGMSFCHGRGEAMPAAAGAASGSVGIQNNNVRRTNRNNEHAAACSSGCASDARKPPQTEGLPRGCLTMDLLMCVSLFLALLSANSRLLMSFRRARYLLICSLMTSSTHLRTKRARQEEMQKDSPIHLKGKSKNNTAMQNKKKSVFKFCVTTTLCDDYFT